MIGKEAMHALRRLSMRFFRLESQPDVNSSYDEDIVLQLDLAHGLRNKALVRCIDLTRFQRAPEGSRKSTGRCRDNIVQGGGMGLQYVRWNFIMFSHCAVNPEDHGLRLGGQVCSADRAFHALDANV
jgi:hypothetical protein